MHRRNETARSSLAIQSDRPLHVLGTIVLRQDHSTQAKGGESIVKFGAALIPRLRRGLVLNNSHAEIVHISKVGRPDSAALLSGFADQLRRCRWIFRHTRSPQIRYPE